MGLDSCVVPLLMQTVWTIEMNPLVGIIIQCQVSIHYRFEFIEASGCTVGSVGAFRTINGECVFSKRITAINIGTINYGPIPTFCTHGKCDTWHGCYDFTARYGAHAGKFELTFCRVWVIAVVVGDGVDHRIGPFVWFCSNIHGEGCLGRSIFHAVDGSAEIFDGHLGCSSTQVVHHKSVAGITIGSGAVEAKYAFGSEGVLHVATVCGRL